MPSLDLEQAKNIDILGPNPEQYPGIQIELEEINEPFLSTRSWLEFIPDTDRRSLIYKRAHYRIGLWALVLTIAGLLIELTLLAYKIELPNYALFIAPIMGLVAVLLVFCHARFHVKESWLDARHIVEMCRHFRFDLLLDETRLAATTSRARTDRINEMLDDFRNELGFVSGLERSDLKRALARSRMRYADHNEILPISKLSDTVSIHRLAETARYYLHSRIKYEEAHFAKRSSELHGRDRQLGRIADIAFKLGLVLLVAEFFWLVLLEIGLATGHTVLHALSYIAIMLALLSVGLRIFRTGSIYRLDAVRYESKRYLLMRVAHRMESLINSTSSAGESSNVSDSKQMLYLLMQLVQQQLRDEHRGFLLDAEEAEMWF